MKRELLANEKGFSLLEVVVALSIFAVFATVFVQSQGTQVNISMGFQEELKMRNLAQQIVNEIMINPPELADSLFAGGGDTKTFENEERYSYTIAWTKFTLPDFNKLKNADDNQQGQTGVESRIMEKVRENMEKLIFQVEITIKNKETGYSHSVTTWLYNNNAILELSGF